MAHYKTPIDDITFVLEDLLKVSEQYKQIPSFSDYSADLGRTVIEEAGKIAEEIFLPLNTVGDKEGCRYDAEKKEVITPTGFKEAYQQYVDGGWSSLSAPAEYGGQGLPSVLNVVLDELFSATNTALSMYSGLTHGAIVALKLYASDALKQRYLQKLISGEFTGTMCLTESHCGTDLGLLKTKAEPKSGSDGLYEITGSKIWITAGEHNFSENIIHLVLARLKGSPEGSKGISLFLVPKFMSDGTRNDIFCTGLEHKMGINGSATCFMSMEKAKGWLIGEAESGLKYMFAMMNSARIMVGMQGLGSAESAYQTSLQFAKERIQGRSPDPALNDENKPADCILVHPDVRRMLLTQKVMTEGCRALAYWVGLEQDIAEQHPDESRRERADDFVALMTPIVKAFLTDQGSLCCDLAVQSMGGSGYTQDWGVEQLVRDVRIARIYEGTNGIQALDLVGRKIGRKGGAVIRDFLQQSMAFIKTYDHPETKPQLEEAFTLLTEALQWLMMNGMKDKVAAVAVATPFLKLMGLSTVALLWAKMAKTAEQKLADGASNTVFLNAKLKSRDVYFSQCLPEITSVMAVIKGGKESLMAFDESEF